MLSGISQIVSCVSSIRLVHKGGANPCPPPSMTMPQRRRVRMGVVALGAPRGMSGLGDNTKFFFFCLTLLLRSAHRGQTR